MLECANWLGQYCCFAWSANTERPPPFPPCGFYIYRNANYLHIVCIVNCVFILLACLFTHLILWKLVYQWPQNQERSKKIQEKNQRHILRDRRPSTTACSACWAIHCYKTLRRIPPPRPDGAGLIGLGRGKWLLYMVREYARSGTEVFRHISEIRNFPGIYMAICQGSPLPMLVLYIPRCRKIFPEFSGDFPVKKWRVWAR